MIEPITLQSLFAVETLLYLFMGTLLGIVVGALPGLTATMAVALLVSLTYGLSGANAITVLIAVYIGGIYGGSRAAILLNVPGTPSSAATALDGFPLTLKGEGAFAGVLVTIFSGLGGIMGLLMVAAATPFLANAALRFAVWEYFWLAMLGVMISSNLTSTKLYKGLIAGFLGMLFSTVGLDPIHGWLRYTFGHTNLMGGITLVPAMIGLFGLAEAFDTIRNPHRHEIRSDSNVTDAILPIVKRSFELVVKRPLLLLRSGIIGTMVGALPGVGPDIASWVSYDAAKRSSKEKEMFGKGSYEGVIASETANNAATSGVFIPLLGLGIPGCGVTAVILGGIQLHGLRPGPTFFFENIGFIHFIVGLLLLVNIAMMVQGVFLTKAIARVLKANVGAIMPVVIVLSVVGAYSLHLKVFDILVMFGFGLLGLLMRRLDIPSAPMALGIILGPMADLNFRRALMAGRYSVEPFFTRPISIVLIIGLVIMFVGPHIRRMMDRRNAGRQGGNAS